MVDELPGHSFLVAFVLGAGALWLIASQFVSIFAN